MSSPSLRRRSPRPIRNLALFAFCGWLISIASATYAPPDLVDIPVERLLAKLGAIAKEKPEDAALQHQLARTHAMAFASNLDDRATVEILKGEEAHGVWFGYEPAHVPYAAGGEQQPSPKNAKPSERALQHLERAIHHYKLAVELEPKDPITRLGLAWCRERAGDRTAAIAGYRDAIERAWASEGKRKFGGLGRFIVSEAAGYLIPLLDRDQDAKEIADLEAKTEKLDRLPRAITPIVIPLCSGVGLDDLVDRSASVGFDLDATARVGQRWQWLRPATAGWLVYDPRATGTITSGIQLFGSRTFTMFFENGYSALALLDDDGDGLLADGELAGLAIWQDLGADGVSGPGEVTPLTAHGITSLSCSASCDRNGVWTSRGGVRFADGSRRDSYDVVLESAAKQ